MLRSLTMILSGLVVFVFSGLCLKLTNTGSIPNCIASYLLDSAKRNILLEPVESRESREQLVRNIRNRKISHVYSLDGKPVRSRLSWDETFMLTISEDDSGSMSSTFKEHGIFAPVETAIFDIILSGCDKPCSTVVDVGVNVGYLSFWASSRGCQVVGFEPQRRLYPLLRQSAKLNKVTNLTIFGHGLSNTETILSQSSPRKWVTARLISSERRTRKDGELVKVDVKRLDSVVSGQVLLLKVDVEGHERQVFEGTTELLDSGNVLNIMTELLDIASFMPMWRKLINLKYTAFCWREDYFNARLLKQACKGQLKYQEHGKFYRSLEDALADGVTDCWFSRASHSHGISTIRMPEYDTVKREHARLSRNAIDKLVVLTTAVNRPEVHLHTIVPLWKSVLSKIDVKVTWIVNMDCSAVISTACASAAQSLEQALGRNSNFLDLKIYLTYRPSFNRAVYTLIRNAESLLDDTAAVLWLEDDWGFDLTNLEAFKSLLKSVPRNECYSLNTLTKRHGLQPILWGSTVFRSYFVEALLGEYWDMRRDPEHLLYVRARKELQQLSCKLDLQRNGISFYDRGRQWAIDKGISKHLGSKAIVGTKKGSPQLGYHEATKLEIAKLSKWIKDTNAGRTEKP
ncbi:methyltransferase FkbM domain-containing protein [Pseudoscourfieldia marina]